MSNIISSDSQTTTDILGRDAFATQIVNSLTLFFTDQPESLVVGISGKWGSGKSTLLEFIKQHLTAHHQENNDQYKILQFNSWGQTAGDDLERSLLEKVVETVSTIGWKDKTAKANSKFKKYLEYLDYIKFAGHFHPLVKTVLDGAKDYREKVNVVSLEEIRLEANALLTQTNTRLYIMIDDLDRLTPSEITMLFRILKVNLNLSNTIFLIAYDKQVVVQALQKEYGFDGEQYLEKIVQVDFPVPQISEAQIQVLFLDKLSRLLSKLEAPFNPNAFRSVWKIHGLKEYFRSIRDLNRYFNNLVFSLPNILSEVNLFDFLVLEAIKTFDGETYHSLYGDIIEIYRKGIWERVGLDGSFIGQYQRGTTRALLTYLFIRQHSDDGQGNLYRLRDRDYFERYFTLTVAANPTPDDLVEHFFLKDSKKEIVLGTAMDTGRLEELLYSLSEDKLIYSHRLENHNIFRDFVDFFRSRTEPATFELGLLIAKAFFNLVRLFEDQHQATRAAVSQFKLEKDKTDRIGYMFKHFLVHFQQLLHLPEEVDRYLQLNSQRLKDNLVTYLRGHANAIFFTLSGISANWIDNLFLNDLVRDVPDDYLRELDDRMLPKLIWFIISHNLFERKEGKVIRVIKEDVDLFFPAGVLTTVFANIKATKPGQLRDGELEELQYFKWYMENR